IHRKAFREARRSAFCSGIFAVSAATASNSAIAEFGNQPPFPSMLFFILFLIQTVRTARSDGPRLETCSPCCITAHYTLGNYRIYWMPRDRNGTAWDSQAETTTAFCRAHGMQTSLKTPGR